MADKQLSIIRGDEEIDLGPDVRSRIRSGLPLFIKAISIVTGLEPLGSLMSEVVKIVPDRKQQQHRLFAEVLNSRIKHLAEDNAELKERMADLKHRLEAPEGIDLLEDAVNQAERALTNERREYIASLLVNGLTDDELEHEGKKKLLLLLEQVNDPEIVLLKFHSLLSISTQREFAEAHKELLMPAPLTLGAADTDVDRAALRDAYRANLAGLGLLRPRYTPQRKGEGPSWDGTTGLPKIQGYDITRLGHILLRYIGIPTDWKPAS